MNELAESVHIINNYIEEYLPAPDIQWPKAQFEERSYSRWAAYELMERVINEASLLPYHITGIEEKSTVEIIEDFIYEMVYIRDLEDAYRSRLCLVAIEVSKDILDIFLKGEI